MKRLIPVIVILLLVSTSFVGLSFEVEMKHNSHYVINNIVDMLIFISPQYKDDEEILQAIENYIAAVEGDVGWSVEIITISTEENFFTDIDDYIESYYEDYNIKACIMVGEDLHTALAGDSDYTEGPSTVPWYTTGGMDAYKIGEEGGVIQTPNRMDICISLIYPTNDLDYTTKKLQIISVFNKFSMQRHAYYTKDLLVFVDADLAKSNNYKTRTIYQTMDDYGNLYYNEDPTGSDVQNSLIELYSMYYVEGHSSPSGTCVSSNGSTGFFANYLDELKTSFFGATGCFVNGWWSAFPDNNWLDPSITNEGFPHYGSMIFISPWLRVMVLGILSSNGWSFKTSFIEHAVQNLTNGMTLAESMIGNIYSGDYQTVVGDPTFHYSFYNNPPDEPAIQGDTDGKTGKGYEYTFNAEDPDGDGVQYFIDWGDGNTSLTELGFSGVNIPVEHVWETEGTYIISSKTIDLYGNESDWTYFQVTMPYTYNPFWQLNEKSDGFPLLQRLLEGLIR